jgi:hypothetical protein
LVIINLQKHYCLTFSPAGKNSLDIWNTKAHIRTSVQGPLS